MEDPNAPDGAAIEDNVLITLYDEQGNVVQQERAHNLVTTVGKNGAADQLVASPSIGKPTHMALGTGATAAAVGDTALVTEIDRNALTSKTRSGAVVTNVADFAAGDATGALTEAGIFDASSSGNLYARVTFAVVNKTAGMAVSIAWTLSAS